MTNFADLIPASCRALRKEVADAECESYDLRKIIRPCVYTFIKKGVSLYIGSSANGMLRFGSPDHHQADIRASADEIVVLWFENVEQAQDIEKRLVRAIEPFTTALADRCCDLTKCSLPHKN